MSLVQMGFLLLDLEAGSDPTKKIWTKRSIAKISHFQAQNVSYLFEQILWTILQDGNLGIGGMIPFQLPTAGSARMSSGWLHLFTFNMECSNLNQRAYHHEPQLTNSATVQLQEVQPKHLQKLCWDSTSHDILQLSYNRAIHNGKIFQQYAGDWNLEMLGWSYLLASLFSSSLGNQDQHDLAVFLTRRWRKWSCLSWCQYVRQFAKQLLCHWRTLRYTQFAAWFCLLVVCLFSPQKCWLSRTVKPFQIHSSKVFHHLQTVLQNQWLIWFWQQPGYAKPSSKGVFASSFPIKPKPEELFNLKNAKKHVFRRGLRSSVSVPMDGKRSMATFEMIESWGRKALEHHCFIVFSYGGCEVGQGGPKFANVRRFELFFS